MANIKLGKEESEIRKMKIVAIKDYCVEISKTYNKIVNGDYIRCCKCGDFKKADTAFYMDRGYFNDRYPICKECILAMVEQREKKNDEPNETKESVQKVLQMMDRVYDDKFYDECVKGARDGAKERNRNSPFSTYITAISSLPNWKGMTWKDSDFGSAAMSADENETRIIQKTVKAGRKIFGNGYSDEDIMFLMNQYEDWKARTQVDSKSQETYVTQICLQLLDIDKDRKKGKDTSNKLKTLDTFMKGANLQPLQNVSNAATDSLSFGQLIEKWEMEKPIPEPDEEFKDVNGIGKLLRVFFAGHLSKAIGLTNGYAKEYDEEMAKYTVEKPQAVEDITSETYQKIFGTDNV